MKSQNLEFLNVHAQSGSSIVGLHERNLIRPGSPNWWSTDYTPDPRRYVEFDLFNDRLADMGDGYKLYPHACVPISILNLEIDAEQFSFMVTARPYHKSEQLVQDDSFFLNSDETFPIRTVAELSSIQGNMRSVLSEKIGPLAIPMHCLPHVRGMFIEARGNHMFWSELHAGRDKVDFHVKIREQLGRLGMSYIRVDYLPAGGFMTRNKPYTEAVDKHIIFNRTVDPAEEYTEVSRLQFFDDGSNSTKNNDAVLYPVRIPEMKHTLPVLVARRTIEGDTGDNPIALGIEAASQYRYPAQGKYGLWPFRDRVVCAAISGALTRDFGTRVDVALRIPRKGRPAYEYISAR